MDLTRPQFVALTAEGGALAARLAKVFEGDWHGLTARMEGLTPDMGFDHALDHIRDLYLSGKPVVGICAAGILIRAISGHLHDKRAEPPLIAMSEDGQAIVPLLGGHHGANDLAARLAAETSADAAITTAGDRRFGLALDAPPPPFVLADRADAKAVMARALAGASIRLVVDLGDDQSHDLAHLAQAWRDWLAPVTAPDGTAPEGTASDHDSITMMLTLSPADEVTADLVFHPQVLTLGLGASRDCPSLEMAALIGRGFAEAGLAQSAIRGVYSVDLKADEVAILDAAAAQNKRLQVFAADRLEEETPRLAQPSEVVFAEIGCHGVAEAAALAGAGPDGQLIKPKIRDDHATMAIAIDPTAGYQPEDCRHPGRVMLVGIGPGQSAWRTPEATAMVAAADELVGYSLYIDLLGPIALGKPRRDFALGEEEARCRFALEEAGKGKDVAIICSGDAGIYAMGALVFELLGRDENNGGVSDAARRVAVESAPGVSALQGAAARSGAILGHDFCTISLSDLLTPWEAIEKRIEAAGQGDFVIAFYNPVSKRRRVGLAKARDILLNYRPAETPVVLASSLGRPEEEIKHRDLGSLDVDEVDMLTVVMIGASTSARIRHGGSGHSGGQVVFTPRGYAKKIDQQ
ncbi:MAG: precorrin-3B C(17)-methyltransferase [Alphaproteobacteria bacterium]|nr:precorrin-3B C(17)-methyltransferase [Alphaproteobacteria bacterium]